MSVKGDTASRSCGTCRERRIICDRTTPTCLQCSHSKKNCKGYVVRFSWPTANDGRRSAVLTARFQLHGNHQAYLVNTTSWDVEIHYHLTAGSRNASQPFLPLFMSWIPSKLDAGEKDLLQYFQSEASQSLATLSHAPVQSGEILMRVALESDSPSTAAVVRSLLALSSLHRYGVQSQAMDLKTSSL
ncbi:hypothetical protein EJ08DRAFT_400259 [Tothia fuscella]|uniref:Zn(2)-C6 fungal-type domain-containing protein n=1 Tax=Tothia fuscella TaxID=1048955 RepID=A0A9P4TVP2_9PEZI|nr:hypothetical protein EJ08DRAFT_400259 [Tothia fuscella]